MAVKYKFPPDTSEMEATQATVYPLILDGWAIKLIENALEYTSNNSTDIFESSLKSMKSVRKEVLKQIEIINRDYHRKLHDANLKYDKKIDDRLLKAITNINKKNKKLKRIKNGKR